MTEFQRIARHTAQSWMGCGEAHARLVATDLAGITYDPADILREAAAIVEDQWATIRARGWL